MLNKILVIDDSDAIKDFIKYCISRNWPSAEVELYDPVEGLPAEDFDWAQYDLVILDYQLGLPDEDGLDWLKILSHYSNIPPILFMTAYSHEDIAVQAIKLGAEDYLNKDDLSAKRLSERIAIIVGEELQKTDINLTMTTEVNKQVVAPEIEKTIVIKC